MVFHKGFKFQPDVCTGCHDVLMMPVNLINIAILNNHGVDYCCIINRINIINALNVLQNANLSEAREVLSKQKKKCITACKMGKEIITFGNIEAGTHKFYQCKRYMM